MYQYAAVESALMQVHAIKKTSRSAFGARIGYFKRIGLLAATPGKGARIVYKAEDVFRLAFCLELCQCGFEPKRAAILGRLLWHKVFEVFLVDYDREDLFLAGIPSMITASFEELASESDEIYAGLIPLEEGAVGWILSADEIRNSLEDRAVLINLSSLARRVRHALPDIGGR